MLNRLFVIVGFLVILAIGAAFLVPRLIQWGDYRGRLETMASQALGAEVSIAGDIELTLLPQPVLMFTDVRVGQEPRPAVQVARVEAHFSLFDFLSDRYRVTELQLERPAVNLAIDGDGRLTSGFVLAEQTEQSNVSIANAEIVDGTLRLFDARSGAEHVAESVEGELRMDALRGPFGFSGTGRHGDERYDVRASTGRLDEAGAASLSVYLRPGSGAYSLEANGSVQTGEALKFTGDLRYRQPPPRALEGELADAGRGDLLLESKVEAVADRVLLSSYTLLPDENRAATRLTGAAEILLGSETAFNAVVSGGVVSLPPRDATKELTDPPYELVRLLAELPLPALPPIPGTLGLDVAEVNLRGLALRDVRLDAQTDTEGWTVETLSAALPGNTRVGLEGEFTTNEGVPAFAGELTIASQQMDRLAAQWRKPPPDNPLFNQAGTLTAQVELTEERLSLKNGTLVIGGINQGFEAALGLGQTRDLTLKAHFTTLGPAESAAVAALLPDLSGNGSFGATFHKGSVDISASKAVLFGIAGTDLAVLANWEGGVLELTRLKAGDFGGARLDAKLTAFGTLAQPEVSGSGRLAVNDGAPLASVLLDTIATPAAVKDFLHRSLPADLTFQLGAPRGEGGQTLNLEGKLGTASFELDAQLSAGIAHALSAPLSATLSLGSDSPMLMAMQLGLGTDPLFDLRSPLRLDARIEGAPANSYEIEARLEGGADHIGFHGNVVPGDFTRISGTGALDVAMADAQTLVGLLGAGGVHVPPIAGTAQLHFEGLDILRLTEIDVAGTTGQLSLARRDGIAAVEGELTAPAADWRALLPLVVGSAGALGDGVWPEGPIDIGPDTRGSTGRVDVAVAEVSNGAEPLLSEVTFGFDWDAEGVILRNLSGNIGEGQLTLDVRVCCSNPVLTAKQIGGRVSLSGVALDRLLPPALASVVDGRLGASAQFDGSGETIAEAVRTMSGSGSYTVADFAARQFNPQTFNEASALDDVMELEPGVLTDAIVDRLRASEFRSNLFSGTFTIAGGVLRSPNLAIAGEGARIFGGGSISLPDLTVDARYAMTPTVLENPEGAVDGNSAEIAAIVRGPLWAPEAMYEVAALVDGMKIRASEIELARLEELRLEDERRQQELARDRARVAEEQAAAALAREAEQARQAEQQAEAERVAEEERLRREADERQRLADELARQQLGVPARPPSPTTPLPPLDLLGP